MGNYWKYRHSARFPSYGDSIRYVLDNYVKHAVPCWIIVTRPATLSTSTICSSWSIGLASSRTKKRRVHSIKWRHVPVIMSYVGFERGVFESWNLPYSWNTTNLQPREWRGVLTFPNVVRRSNVTEYYSSLELIDWLVLKLKSEVLV